MAILGFFEGLRVAVATGREGRFVRDGTLLDPRFGAWY